MLQNRTDEARAFDIAAKLRYRHYVVADSTRVTAAPAGSVLAALKSRHRCQSWLARQLASIQCVASTEEGARVAANGSPDAYYRDGRGGRSDGVEPREHQFGTAALESRRVSRSTPRPHASTTS